MAVREIPLILTNQSHLLDAPESSLLGTQNFETTPKAVVFGGAFTDQDIAAVQSAIDAMGNGNVNVNVNGDGTGGKQIRVPLLKADKAQVPTGGPPGPEYVKKVQARLLACLERLKVEGFERRGEIVF